MTGSFNSHGLSNWLSTDIKGNLVLNDVSVETFEGETLRLLRIVIWTSFQNLQRVHPTLN